MLMLLLLLLHLLLMLFAAAAAMSSLPSAIAAKIAAAAAAAIFALAICKEGHHKISPRARLAGGDTPMSLPEDPAGCPPLPLSDVGKGLEGWLHKSRLGLDGVWCGVPGVVGWGGVSLAGADNR